MIEYKVSTATRRKRSFADLHVRAKFDRYADAYAYQRRNAPTFLKGKSEFVLLDEYRDGKHVGRWSMDANKVEETVFVIPKSMA